MTNEELDELFGYEEHVRDEATHADYMREAYGDPCPRCRTLRWQADCPKCMQEEQDEAEIQGDREAGTEDPRRI